MRARVLVTQNDIRQAVADEVKAVEQQLYTDTARQLMAVILYTLHLKGWRKKRLMSFSKDVGQTFDIIRRGVFDNKKFDALDCIAFIKDRYGIDLVKEISTETKVKHDEL